MTARKATRPTPAPARAADAWGVVPDPPAQLSSPWATTPTRREDGLYVEAESSRVLAYWGWLDAFARHYENGRPRWSRSPGGVLYLLAGDRVGLLWPGWSAGHLAVAGGDGVWLLSGVPFEVARRGVEEWWLAEVAALAAGVDVDALLTIA